ncbi:MAG: fibronectin type III domain-containing protein [Desulfobacterales bacterium]
MSLLRFKVFQPIFFKTATFFSIVMSAFLYAGNAYSADVTLAWDGVSQSGVTVTGYRVYYRADVSSGLTKGCEVASTSCTVSDLADGETYHFVATAYNSYGESEPSDPVSYTVPDVLQTFTITSSTGGYGSISPSGTVNLTEGESKTFTITPTSGFRIQAVLVDGTDIGASSQYTFNDLSANHTIHATFASNPVTLHTIDASDDGHGSISPKGSVTVIEGNDQNFKITPTSGYHIADVWVDGQSIGTQSNYEFLNVTGTHTISASFAANMFTITATPGSNGSIKPGTVSVPQGTGKTFTIAAGSGYEIADVIVDNQSKGVVTSYTFNDIAANHTIAATFDAVTAVVPTDDDPSGSTSTGDSSSTSDSSGSTDTTSNSGVPSGTVIIDNGDSGTSATGAWSVSAGTGPYGTDSLYSKTVSETYSFETNRTGLQEVYLWWTYYGSRYTQVPVQIYDGTELLNTVIVNQQQNGSQWNFLGTYTFSGTAKVVIVSSSSSESTSADAVKFVTASSIIPNDPSGSSDTPIDSSSTNAGDSSGSPSTSDSNGATTDNNSSIVTPAVTPAQEFVNQAPDQPGLLFPGEGAQDVSLTPLLEIAGFTDPDAEDDHGATRWQIATDDSFGQLILDVTIDRSRTNNYLVNFLVPDGALCSEQLYYWRASVKDARDVDSKWSYWSEMFTFTTAARVQADVNGNGVADEEEPEYSDLDNDGLNDNDQPLMRVYKSRKGQSLIGINAVEGVSQINCFTSIDPESIPDEPRPKLKYGLMVFNVALNQIGGTARFELYLPEKPRIEAKWYKYDPINGWYEFPVDIVGDKYFIEITDGGFGDADGAENGIIVDPIGLAEMSAELESFDALDAIDSGDSESTMDRLKNACFIQVALDRPAVETTDAGTRQMVAFRFIYSGIMALVLAVAVIQVMGGRRGNRTHSSPRSNGRSRSA